jgi:hypothetical protein
MIVSVIRRKSFLRVIVGKTCLVSVADKPHLMHLLDRKYYPEGSGVFLTKAKGPLANDLY